MKIDFSRRVLNLRGQAMYERVDDRGEAADPLTLASVAYIALTQTSQAGQTPPVAETYARGKLARRIDQDPACVEITTAEATTIKEAVAGMGPHIVAFVWDTIEGAQG